MKKDHHLLAEILASLLLLVGLTTWQSAAANAQSAWEVDRQVEEAIHAENWAKVAELLDSVNIQTPSPVLRLIKGHATLALNRNNESLCLFSSISSEGELRKWEEWTQELANKYQRSAIAYYFGGDASARLEKWEEALTSFNQALELHPNHPMVLNARGVTHAAKGEFDPAREDFKKASETAPPLAEIFASWGTYILQRKTDAQIALERFDRALKISPDYVLALNGRGSARILRQDWDTALSDLKEAKTQATGCLSGIEGVVDLNLASLTDKRNEEVSTMLAIAPGFSLQEKLSTLDRMTPPQRQAAFDVLNNARNFNGNIQGGFLNPSKTELGVSGGIKGSIVGPRPFLEGKTSATWNWSGKAKYNHGQQTGLMDAMSERYGITQANPINNLKAFGKQHMLPGGKYGKLTSPKGWSSREIGEKPVDTGNWNVFTLYGLLYKIKSDTTHLKEK